MCWHCESVGYYRSLEAGSADFSRDGSLLAVAFRRSVTLWDPDTNQLRTVLPGINRGNDIKQTRCVSCLRGSAKKTISKNPRLLWNWVGGGSRSLGIFFVENHPKIALKEW